MRATIHKLFWMWQFDKEEKWLNEMAAKGFTLIGVGFCRYDFEESLRGEYSVRMELLENLPSNAESMQYIRFVEETGAEYLGSIIRFAYFRKRKDKGEFDLYSDNDSKIKYLNRMLCMLFCFTVIELFTGILNIVFFFTVGMEMNLLIGALCVCVGLLIGFGTFQVNKKKNRLKKEKYLFQ